MWGTWGKRKLMSWPKRQLRPRRQQCSRFPLPEAVQNKISSSEPCLSGHGPFPSYLFRFEEHPDNCYACGEPGTPFHYTTKCRLTLSFHFKYPVDQHIEAWLKSITNHHLLRNKIIDLLNFITSQEDLLKSEEPE
ncbi:hypothetical protein AVEN_88903-1 [Araneus ventricosus]|uniref:Uncharacterized protein n=1 Tax=Araneus ventricosus TaxID=182803 RepID=A0A4Y2M083_ARAVE|nr:hypothetical protein AVEN_88903-1 [Araneus ventricosus]